MRIFTLFPDLLFLTIFAFTLLRVAVAGMLAYSARHHFASHDAAVRVFAILEIASATGLFLGAWTQLFSLLASLMLIIALTLPQFRVWPRSTVALMLVITISLLVTGPGAFAFDYGL